MGAYGQGGTPTFMMGRVGQEGRWTDDGNFDQVSLNRQGAQVTVDQVLQWAIEGRTFHAQQGDAQTQVNFAEVAYDEDQPQFALTVPAGKVVIPLSLIVTLEDAAGTDTLLAWSTTTNDIGVGTSTSLTISPMRRDAPHASGCTANSLYTGNATAATGLIEIIRFLDAFAQAASGKNRFAWDIRQDSAIPILVGPATLQMHVSATAAAPQGFTEVVWAEFDTPQLVKKV